MRGLALCLALAFPVAATAEVLPALFDVEGVAANDVLNVRIAPDAASAIVGSLPPGQSGVEVMAVNEDGKWAQVNVGEGSGWVARRFLKERAGPVWYSNETALVCFGTEPFWSLEVDGPGQSASLDFPDAESGPMDILQHWPGEEWRQVAALQFATQTGGGFAAIRAEACSDGMSDRAFGLAVDVFLRGEMTPGFTALRGCCSLAP